MDSEPAKKPDWVSESDLDIFCEFLDGLRETGVTNMFGSGTYLEDFYELTEEQAREVFVYWAKTFDERGGRGA